VLGPELFDLDCSVGGIDEGLVYAVYFVPYNKDEMLTGRRGEVFQACTLLRLFQTLHLRSVALQIFY